MVVYFRIIVYNKMSYYIFTVLECVFLEHIVYLDNSSTTKPCKEAIKQINMKRAKMLLDVAKAGGKLGALAQKVVSALGVHRKNGRYASGAEKLLAEKLSG